MKEERLAIIYEPCVNGYILWRQFIDPMDKIHPVKLQLIEHVNKDREACKRYAEKYIPELYHVHL